MRGYKDKVALVPPLKSRTKLIHNGDMWQLPVAAPYGPAMMGQVHMGPHGSCTLYIMLECNSKFVDRYRATAVMLLAPVSPVSLPHTHTRSSYPRQPTGRTAASVCYRQRAAPSSRRFIHNLPCRPPHRSRPLPCALRVPRTRWRVREPGAHDRSGDHFPRRGERSSYIPRGRRSSFPRPVVGVGVEASCCRTGRHQPSGTRQQTGVQCSPEPRGRGA
jgi:hypothetical protein